MSTGIKPLDQEYLTSIFDTLSKLEVQLDADPLVYGPKRLNGKVALARKMLTECERIFLDISQQQANYKRAHRAATLILDMKLKHLLANDPETRAGRAVSEREATAYGKLQTEVQEVADAQNALEELEAVMAVVKAKRSDLRDIQGRLRDQVRLCGDEISIGGRWGSKNPRGVELQPGQGFADGDDVAAIENVIQVAREVADAEMHLKAEVDDSDTTAEEEAALVASADDAGDVSDEQVPGSPPLIGGLSTDLEAEFGFVPHCEKCGEIQTQTPSGMTCPNGHGGAASVPPPPSDVLAAGQGTPDKDILPGTVQDEDVDAFLSDPTNVPAPEVKKSRFQVEEEEGLELEAILASFGR